MTVGAPDFQGYTAWQTLNQAAAANQVLPPGLTTLFSGPVSSFASILVRVVPSTQQGSVTVAWFTDAALAHPAGSNTWTITSSVGLAVIVPVRSAFVQVQVNNQGAGNMTTDTLVAPLNVQASAISFPVGAQRIYRNAVSVAASGTDQTSLPFISRGSGQVSFTPADATAKLSVKVVVLLAGGAQAGQLLDLGTPAAAVNSPCVITDERVALLVTNTDGAAAHTFTGSLVCAAE